VLDDPVAGFAGASGDDDSFSGHGRVLVFARGAWGGTYGGGVLRQGNTGSWANDGNEIWRWEIR
jgi:hypothetical protein